MYLIKSNIKTNLAGSGDDKEPSPAAAPAIVLPSVAAAEKPAGMLAFYYTFIKSDTDENKFLAHR